MTGATCDGMPISLDTLATLPRVTVHRRDRARNHYGPTVRGLGTSARSAALGRSTRNDRTAPSMRDMQARRPCGLETLGPPVSSELVRRRGGDRWLKSTALKDHGTTMRCTVARCTVACGRARPADIIRQPLCPDLASTGTRSDAFGSKPNSSFSVRCSWDLRRC